MRRIFSLQSLGCLALIVSVIVCSGGSLILQGQNRDNANIFVVGAFIVGILLIGVANAPPNINTLKAKGNVRRLIDALDYQRITDVTRRNNMDNLNHVKSYSARQSQRQAIQKTLDTNLSIRKGAAEALGELRDKRAITPLIKMLQDPDTSTRRIVIEALGKIAEAKIGQQPSASGNNPAVEPLILALKDNTPAIRAAAAQSLGMMRDERAADALVLVSGDGYAEVRKAAANALGKLGVATQPALVKALRTGQWVVRENVAVALAQQDWKPQSPSEAAQFYVAKQDWVQVGALGSEGVDALLLALNDAPQQIKVFSVEKLGQIRDTRALNPLTTALAGKDAQVAKAAANALGAINDDRAIMPLVAALGHYDSGVRSAAQAALTKFGERALGSLLSVIENSNAQVRQGIVETLGTIHDQRTVEPLVAALADQTSAISTAAVIALGKQGSLAINSLVSALGSANQQVRQKAVEALGKLGRDGIQPLVVALKSKDVITRQSAAKLLESLAWSPSTDLDKAYYAFAKSDWDRATDLGSVAVQPLITFLDDDDWRIRYLVSNLLTKPELNARDALLEAFKDSNASARSRVMAATTLRNLNMSQDIEPQINEVIQKGIEDLKNTDAQLRLVAAETLWALKPAQAANALIAALAIELDVDVAKTIAMCLGELKDAQAVDPLCKALTLDSSKVRRKVAWALGNIGDDRAIPYLENCLRSRDKVYRVKGRDEIQKTLTLLKQNH